VLGIRVLELGDGLAAGYACKLLVDLGATVTKVEPPRGAPLRRWGPAPSAAAERGSGLFQYLTAGKRSIVLDTPTAADRGRLSELAAGHDVLIESLGPGRLEELEVSLPPAVVRISPFGQSGPYRDRAATSAVLQAAGGWTARIGTPEGPPYFVGGHVEEYVAGAYAAAAALTAHRHAAAIGERVEVDVSIMECIVGTVPYPMLQKITFDRLGFPVPQRYQPIPGIMRCRDGHVGISSLTGQHWSDVCALLEVPELGEKMREVTLRGAEWQQFVAKAEPWLLARNAAEIVEVFQAMRVPAVPIGNGANLPKMEPFASRRFYIEQPGGGFLRPQSPLRSSAMPTTGEPRFAPRLNEHAGSARAAGASAVSGGANTSMHSSWGGGRNGLPFTGLRVLDLTTFWAGPYFTMYLASFGADVIKVESPKRPDGFRFVAAFPQLGDRWWEQSGVFHATNLGKRAITLDLDDPRGKELALRLVADADVVAENFSPRVVEHFGIDYETVRKANRRAIMVRMPGFGLSGPCRDWVGWALTFEQMAGCAEITGEPSGRMFAPGGFADPAVGMHAAAALQAALAYRERTGEGQLIEVAQIEAVAAMTAEQVIHHSLTGELLTRTANRSGEVAPQGVYRTAGDDEWVAVSVRDAEDWAALCGVMGRDDWLKDARLRELARRRERHDDIDRVLSQWAAARTSENAERELVAAGVPAARLLKTTGFYLDPHLVARGHFHELDHEVCGPLSYPSWPLRFSSGPIGPYASGAPTLGRHNDEILHRVLGLSDGEIAELRAARVIGESI
jgi:crotonobetainyl-CoA:carnitine CoA-transferase CaiB-like acyl-CoA transferase